jgi:ABC-type transport system substrate-binding protein
VPRLVQERVTLLHVDAPGNRAIALALRAAWQQLGIETTIRARAAEGYLDFRGPLSRDSVDLYQLDLRYPFADAAPGLSLWTCRSDRNKTNFCRARFDELVADARREGDASARQVLATRAEEVLSGADGALPGIPIYWHTRTNLEALPVRETFAVSPLGQIDLAAVELAEG